MQGSSELNMTVTSMVLRGALRLVSGRLARVIITLSGLAILSRLLTPADFGVVAIALTMFPLATQLTHGLIEVPMLRREEVDDEELFKSVWLSYLVMMVLFCVIWALAPTIAYQLDLPELSHALRIFSFGLLLQPSCAAGEAILRSQRQFGALAVLMPLTAGVYVVSAILMALNGMGFLGIVYGHMLSLLARAVGAIWLSRVPLFPVYKLDLGLLRGNGGLGVMSGFFGWAASNIDTVFAGAVLGASGAGLYSRAYNITTQLKDPFTSLNFAVREAFLSHKKAGRERARRATMLGLRLVFLASALVAAIVIVLRQETVLFLLGNQWTEASLPLAILLVSLPFKVTRTYLNNFALVSGSLGHLVQRNFVLCLLMLASLWSLSDYGLLGLSAGVTIVHIVVCVLFPGGKVDTDVAGTLAARALAMLPGFVLASLLVMAGAVVDQVFADQSWLAKVLIKCLLCGFWCISVGILWPIKWLPKQLAVVRSKMLTLGDRGKSVEHDR